MHVVTDRPQACVIGKIAICATNGLIGRLLPARLEPEPEVREGECEVFPIRPTFGNCAMDFASSVVCCSQFHCRARERLT